MKNVDYLDYLDYCRYWDYLDYWYWIIGIITIILAYSNNQNKHNNGNNHNKCYSWIKVDMLEVEIDTWQEWCLPGFSSSLTALGQVCAKNALKSMVLSWLFNEGLPRNKSVRKMHFFFQDWIDAHPIGSRLYRIMSIIRTIGCFAICEIIEIDILQ